MKIIAVHSHKGGVGKTTIALLLAKYASNNGRNVHVVDFDFLGAGIADLIRLEGKPDRYLESYFNSADPYTFDEERLFSEYTDDDIKPNDFTIILNLSAGLPKEEKKNNLKLKRTMEDAISVEPHYGEIQTKSRILFDKLGEKNADLAIADCHPGLGFISKSLIALADLNIYVTTPNRSDCFGLLKEMNNRKKIDSVNSFLIVNRAVPRMIDLKTFKTEMKSDPLVKRDMKIIFGNLKHIGRDETLFSIIPHSDHFRKLFYIGGTGLLPRITDDKKMFDFCSKVLEKIDG